MSGDLRDHVARKLSDGLRHMHTGATVHRSTALATRAALRRGVRGGFGSDSAADAALLAMMILPGDADGDPLPFDARLGRLLDDAALVASLVAATQVRVHVPVGPDDAPLRNSCRSFGRDLRWLRQHGRESATDALLSAILRAPREQLPRHLRRALTLMHSDDAAVDVYSLVRDLGAWELDGRPAQKQWAFHFWSDFDTPKPTTEEKS